MVSCFVILLFLLCDVQPDLFDSLWGWRKLNGLWGGCVWLGLNWKGLSVVDCANIWLLVGWVISRFGEGCVNIGFGACCLNDWPGLIQIVLQMSDEGWIGDGAGLFAYHYRPNRCFFFFCYFGCMWIFKIQGFERGVFARSIISSWLEL